MSRHAWASDELLSDAWPRFVAKVAANDNHGCWCWLGGRSKGGGHSDHAGFYGSFHVTTGVKVRAHIFSWLASGEAFPPELTLDHTCRNTLCVNPAHLELVTIAENNRRKCVALGMRWAA